ncbi:MAG: formimidoylglutamase [Actinomycetes bacterium]
MTATTRAPEAWAGRDDGPGDEHARWHSAIGLAPATGGVAADIALVGFCSDEGVRRNHGRPGAFDGPAAIRAALAQLAAPRRPDGTVVSLVDIGDVVVSDGDLEGGQELLGDAVRGIVDSGALAVVLGGGHEVAYGTYLGISSSRRAAKPARLGVFNLDAHFDLRAAERASSGTPFLQIVTRQRALGREFRYFVAGISPASNTRALFDTAGRLGVGVLTDDDCAPETCRDFVEEFLAQVDLVHLTVDLDVLPAAVAPGVSAPAGFGVELSGVRQMCRAVARSGKLAVVEIAELNPRFDVDGRTARLAARLADEIVRTVVQLPGLRADPRAASRGTVRRPGIAGRAG